LTNGKFYIGQSKNISVRWKAHTKSLTSESCESVIRMAFAKHGLRQQVSRAGKYGNFSFEVLELCGESSLLEREGFYIDSLKPEYNIMRVGPNEYFRPTRHNQGKYFVQYHSLEQRGYFPEYDSDSTTDILDAGIYSRKAQCKNMLGANIVLILGIKPGNSKKTIYYLWSLMLVENIDFDFENQDYVLYGIETLLKYPINLSEIVGFADFKMRCGNFGYGLQAMENYKFFAESIIPKLVL
jgi:hypothetical protein